MGELKDHVNEELYEECSAFIKNVRESRHTNILERHLNKFNRLCQQPRDGCSKNTGGCPINTGNGKVSNVTLTTTTPQMNKWVKNLSRIPLNKAHVSLLTHGPNFALAPRHLSYGQYMTAVEQMSQNLEPHETEELRVEI